MFILAAALLKPPVPKAMEIEPKNRTELIVHDASSATAGKAAAIGDASLHPSINN